MKYLLNLIVIVAFLSIVFSANENILIESPLYNTIQAVETINVKVIKVIDWDTFSFYYKGELVNTRMIWIDAPESNTKRYWYAEKWGKEAKAFLNKLIAGQYVTIQYDASQSKIDMYNRHLVYVFLNWENINNTMIANCHAKEYTFKTAYKFQNLFKESAKLCK